MMRLASIASWRAKFLLLIVSVGVCVAGAEIYFRLTSPHILRKSTPALVGKEVLDGDYGYFMDGFSGRRLIPGTRIDLVIPNGNKVPIAINSQGFRDEEFPTRKQPTETRILVLGDSITFGSAVPIMETFPKRTETHLIGLALPGRIRCINGGVEGIGIKDEVDILVERGLSISPDIVVVAFFLNDGNPPDRMAAGLGNPGFIRRRSVLAQTIFRAYKSYQYHHGNLPEAKMYGWLTIPPPGDWRTNRASMLDYAKVAEADWGAAWKPSVWIGIEAQMQRLDALAREKDFKVVFVALPVALQVYSEYVEDYPQRQLETLCARYGFGFLDLLPLLRSQARQESAPLFLDHCHLTASGHDVAGKALASDLADTFFMGATSRFQQGSPSSGDHHRWQFGGNVHR